MRISIPQKTLAAALGKIQAITAGRSTMPILACVLLEPLAQIIKITATDLEVGYTTAVDNLVWLDEEPKDGYPLLALPAKKLHECVKAIPVSMVDFTINMENRRVEVSGGTVTFTLAGQDPAEYPSLPEFSGENFDLDAAALLDILSHVAYAQSKDVEKYNLAGCFLKIEANQDDELFFTAASPMATITGKSKDSLVQAFLLKYYGSDQNPQMLEPLHTVTTRDRFGLVTVRGEAYQIVDIGMRMLSPRELFRAQGFQDNYIIDRDANGKPINKTDQVARCGNSVCPPIAEALVRANMAVAENIYQKVNAHG
jgi:hypothetical protein